MANTTSAKKATRKIARRTATNKVPRSSRRRLFGIQFPGKIGVNCFAKRPRLAPRTACGARAEITTRWALGWLDYADFPRRKMAAFRTIYRESSGEDLESAMRCRE